MERTLSALERAIELASLESPVNFALTARLEGRLGETELRSALDRLAPAHPLLSSRIAGEDGRTRLVVDASPRFPIRAVEPASDQDWVETTRLQLLTPFHRRIDPPARFTLLRGGDWTDLIICCDHAVSDGLSAAYLIRQLLALLADPTAPVPPPSTIPPPLPDLAPERVRRHLRFRLGLIRGAARGLLPILARFAGPDVGENRSPAPSGFHLMAWSLDPEATARLAAAARRQQTTVHAAVGAAFLLAFAEGETRKTRRISCPISLRERAKTPIGEAFGLFVSIVETDLDCAPAGSFWEVARDLKANLTKASSDSRLWLPVLAAEAAMKDRRDADLRAMMTRFSPKIRYDLSITNLGRLDFPRREKGFRLRALHGPAVSGQPDERILGVSTAAGRMTFTLTFRDHTLDRAQAEALRARGMSLLASAVD